MPPMQKIEALAAEAAAATKTALRDAESAVSGFFDRETPVTLTQPAEAASAPHGATATPVPAVPTTQENHMTISHLLADADAAAAALVKHVKTLAANPLIDTLIESGAGLLLTPGEVTAVVSFIHEIEAERKALAAPTAAAVGGAQGVAAAFQADGTQQAQATLSGAQPVQTGAM